MLDAYSDTLELLCQPVCSLRDVTVQWELLHRLPSTRQLDERVLGQAIDMIAASRRHGFRLELELKLSGPSLRDLRFADAAADRLRGSGIDPSCLILEVSEADLEVGLDEIRYTATRLRALGCRIALDDVGPRCDIAGHLRRFPADFVKVGWPFTHCLTADIHAQLMVRTIIDLAHAMNRKVIAAEVADEATLVLLQSYGVDFAQGSHIGLPTAC
ncbi:EAL domain-containing protein [Aquihabitans sp. G128]|uniref:EAL domain-containing protein n=1 Tax=Aquihabitans sp. G128 TaxID=2849779 RepID=UPI001C2245CC|nr:EAL domain-containing protein [Aquihabitans sp. G128]QXC60670.1 EAL domain-containing protein [Aquihabitans sp. G128]